MKYPSTLPEGHDTDKQREEFEAAATALLADCGRYTAEAFIALGRGKQPDELTRKRIAGHQSAALLINIPREERIRLNWQYRGFARSARLEKERCVVDPPTPAH